MRREVYPEVETIESTASLMEDFHTFSSVLWHVDRLWVRSTRSVDTQLGLERVPDRISSACY